MNPEPEVPKEGPAEPAKGLPPGPQIVFRPDPDRQRRVARFRKLVLIVTVVLIAGALVLVLRLEPAGPRPRLFPAQAVPSQQPAPPETAQPPVAGPTPASDQRKGLVDSAVQTVARIDTAVAAAVDRWRRAQGYLPVVVPGPDRLEPTIAHVHKALVIAESAALDLGAAQALAERIKEASRRPGLDGYRLSVLYSASRNYLGLLVDDAQDRTAYLEATEQAFRALANGDQNEFEIKQNVTNGFGRKIEVRQRRIQQARRQVEEALTALRLAQ